MSRARDERLTEIGFNLPEALCGALTTKNAAESLIVVETGESA